MWQYMGMRIKTVSLEISHRFPAKVRRAGLLEKYIEQKLFKISYNIS